jgi:glutathione S-transferase
MTMAEFTVHSIPGSPYGRAVLIALEEKGAAYEFSPVAPGTFRSPEHLARHPFGKVPVLDHGDFRLYETQAVLRYLDRVLPTPALTPADPRAAARMDQAMNINDCYLFNGVSNTIGFQRVVGPRLMGLKPDEAVIEAALPRGKEVFGTLAGLLGGQAYFGGESVSLADILLAPQLDFFRDIPEWEILAGPHSNLGAWLDRMNARPSLKKTTWERVAELAQAA